MKVTKKHAYLIIAHNNFSQLQMLISLIDDPRNDIYLHVDKKAKNFCDNDVSTQYSKLILIDRMEVNWGGHTQITCEMNLLKAAASGHYQYYHLLSGIDLPLKTQDEIHEFFSANYPSCFIEFDEQANTSGNFTDRVDKYHFLQNVIGRKTGRWIAILGKIESYSLRLQKKIGFCRKQYIKAYKGANWFSITDDLVQYTLQQERLIKKQFYYSICGDEVFLQSVAMASPYHKYIVNNDLREIDWERGKPYVYRQEDVETLLRSPQMFARKFDINIDRAAIDDVIAYLKKKDTV